MLTETSNLNEKLDQSTAATAARRKKSQKQVYVVPKEIQKEADKISFEPAIEPVKYKEQSFREYFMERWYEYIPIVCCCHCGVEQDEFYYYCWNICVNAYCNFYSVSEETAEKCIKYELEVNKDRIQKEFKENKKKYNNKRKIYEEYGALSSS